ncbi:MAG: hypothetical protein U1E53_21345 [Dongiaceae bacterium]
MKKREILLATVTTLVTVLVAVVGLLALDAVLHLKNPATSYAARFYATLFPHRVAGETRWPILTDGRQIEPYVELFKENGVGLGNSPYRELRTKQGSINQVVDGCLEMKPNLRKTLSFMRSELYNNFDPLNYFYDTDRKLPAELQAFLDRYTFRKVHLTTDANGYRITVPKVESPDKILIMGDSMAMSAMVEDDETLASQLQARDPKHQYISIGVGGASAEDVVCALERAVKRYPGQIRGIIYPYSEGDLHANHPLGAPERLIPRLAKIKEEAGIQDFTIIAMTYIYNSMPELTRIPGTRGYDFPRNTEEKARLLKLAREAGFRTFDFIDVTLEEQKASGSAYAPFAFFIDISHLSREGIRRLVDLLTSPTSSAS